MLCSPMGGRSAANDLPNEDLFWRCAAAAATSVSTSFEFQPHEVSDIVGGPMFYEVDDAAAVLACYGEFIADAPEQLGCFFGWQIRLHVRRGCVEDLFPRWSSAGTAT